MAFENFKPPTQTRFFIDADASKQIIAEQWQQWFFNLYSRLDSSGVPGDGSLSTEEGVTGGGVIADGLTITLGFDNLINAPTPSYAEDYIAYYSNVSSKHYRLHLGNIDHDQLLNYVVNEHIDWTNATDNLLTTGTGTFSGTITVNGTAATAGKIVLGEDTDNGAHTVTIQAPASLAASYTLTLPDDDGASGEVLTTDGSGVLSWEASATSGIGTIEHYVITATNAAFAIPAGASHFSLQLQGAGGGGGGGDATTGGGGGGGAGVTFLTPFNPIAGDTSMNIVIGAGGTGAIAGADGSAGTSSTLTLNNTSRLWTAYGGGGGGSNVNGGGGGGSAGTGGAGGNATTATAGAAGSASGAHPIQIPATLGLAGGNAGAGAGDSNSFISQLSIGGGGGGGGTGAAAAGGGGASAAINYIQGIGNGGTAGAGNHGGGGGGAAGFGRGGTGGNDGVVGSNYPTGSYGAGGGGGGRNAAGGNGGPGVCILTFYVP